MNILIQGWNLEVIASKPDSKNNEIIFISKDLQLDVSGEKNIVFYNTENDKFSVLLDFAHKILDWLKRPDQCTHPQFANVQNLHASIVNELMTMPKNNAQISSEKFFSLLKQFPVYSLMIVDQLRHIRMNCVPLWEKIVVKMLVKKYVGEIQQRFKEEAMLVEEQKKELSEKHNKFKEKVSVWKKVLASAKSEKEIAEKKLAVMQEDNANLYKIIEDQRKIIGEKNEEITILNKKCHSALQSRKKRLATISKKYHNLYNELSEFKENYVADLKSEVGLLREKNDELEALWEGSAERAKILDEKLCDVRRKMAEKLFENGKQIILLKKELQNKYNIASNIISLHNMPIFDKEMDGLKMIVRFSQLKFCYRIGRTFSETMFKKRPECEVIYHPLIARIVEKLEKIEDKSDILQKFLKEYGNICKLKNLIGHLQIEEYLTGVFYYSWFCFQCPDFTDTNYLPDLFSFFWKLNPNYEKIVEVMNNEEVSIEGVSSCFGFYNFSVLT